jgi:hypothetical protein
MTMARPRTTVCELAQNGYSAITFFHASVAKQEDNPDFHDGRND